jgi:hypothetical protein
MTTRTHRQVLIGAIALAAFVTGGAGPAFAKPGSSGSAKSGYNAIPSKVSGNVPSQPFQAQQTNEFGDEVTLGGSARNLQSMSVVLSSWGCQSGTWNGADCQTTQGATFAEPITFTVYEDNAGTPGAVITQQTQTVAVAYRPSASARCTGEDAGKWWSATDKKCYSGLPQTVRMTFSGVQLPADVIWSVAYSTSGYGPLPYGYDQPCNSTTAGCGYDSLNVGAKSFANAPFAGTDVDEDKAFRNGAMESGWTGFRPLGALATG